MPISESKLVALRPFAYHATTKNNLHAIAEARQLISSRALLTGTPHEYLLRDRRPKTVPINVGKRKVDIRDQKPLFERNILLQQGLSFQDFIDELNGRVFFWAGGPDGPVESGVNHFERYRKEESTIYVIRAPLQALIDANRSRALFVTRCNSGSPRFNQGRPAPRGRDTFQTLPAAEFTSGKVIELSYVESADLPIGTEWATSLEGTWKLLEHLLPAR